ADLLTLACLRQFHTTRFDVITYVPLHQSRMQERGFNQAERLAVLVGQRLGLPVASFLRRSRQTAKLSKQAGRDSRYQSLQGAFEPVECSQLLPFFKRSSSPRILMIDDIYTTGATLRSCASAIST
ncbi:hypothetical protein MXD81_13120, partial [Microbacteriaceae bacterium K1510]|nr:hypothetical protein [Microbacteriaceae bacterium K1510]